MLADSGCFPSVRSLKSRCFFPVEILEKNDGLKTVYFPGPPRKMNAFCIILQFSRAPVCFGARKKIIKPITNALKKMGENDLCRPQNSTGLVWISIKPARCLFLVLILVIIKMMRGIRAILAEQ